MSELTKTPIPPYYAVIFSSLRTEGENEAESEADKDYSKMADEMLELASHQNGFLGAESAREELGITVSYWENLESIKAWKQNSDHLIAQQKGRQDWYRQYKVRICKVERDYDFFA